MVLWTSDHEWYLMIFNRTFRSPIFCNSQSFRPQHLQGLLTRQSDNFLVIEAHPVEYIPQMVSRSLSTSWVRASTSCRKYWRCLKRRPSQGSWRSYTAGFKSFFLGIASNSIRRIRFLGQNDRRCKYLCKIHLFPRKGFCDACLAGSLQVHSPQDSRHPFFQSVV